MTEEADRLAAELWTTARDQEQCVRRIPSDDLAEQIRAAVRRLAAADGVQVRTARMEDVVLVVRLEADVWTDDAATMRAKLDPDR